MVFVLQIISLLKQRIVLLLEQRQFAPDYNGTEIVEIRNLLILMRAIKQGSVPKKPREAVLINGKNIIIVE